MCRYLCVCVNCAEENVTRAYSTQSRALNSRLPRAEAIRVIEDAAAARLVREVARTALALHAAGEIAASDRLAEGLVDAKDIGQARRLVTAVYDAFLLLVEWILKRGREAKLGTIAAHRATQAILAVSLRAQ